VETEGTHEIADLWFDGPLPAGWPGLVVAALRGPGCMTVLEVGQHQFEPQGESWFWLLGESHCSAHTFPEHDYLSLDIYGCGAGQPGAAMDAIIESLSPTTIVRNAIARGCRERPQEHST